jgi:hypothetical protein
MFAAKDKNVVAVALLVATAVAVVAQMISWGVVVSGEMLALSAVAAAFLRFSLRGEVQPVRVDKTRPPRSARDL